MARRGDTYRGPRMPLWRRLVLRYSGSIAWTLALAWLGLMASTVLARLSEALEQVEDVTT